MTKDEFQSRYQAYQTPDRRDALDEAAKVNAQANGFEAVAINFPGLGYGLMLADAADFLRECGMGLVPEIDAPPNV